MGDRPPEAVNLRGMRLRSLAVLGACALVFAGCGTLFEPTAATVNGHKITIERVDAAGEKFVATPRFKELAQEGQGDEIRRQFEQSFLTQLISHDIITAEAEEAGIEASDEEVTEQIEVIKQNFENEEAFQKALADQALDEAQLPSLVRDQILEQKLHEQVVEDIEVTPEEISDYYDENITDYQQTRAAHILVKPKDEALAGRLASQLQDTPVGERKALFAQLAKQHSIDPTSAKKGGDLGLAPSSKYVPSFAAAIDALELNEISDPVETQFGFHIILVTKRVTAPLSEASETIRTQLEGPKADKAWSDWLREAYEDADVKVNPRYGVLDIPSRRVVDADPQDVPGSDVEETPSAPAPGQPEESPPS